MHMVDALLSPAVAAGMYLVSGTATGYSVNSIKKAKAPVMASEMGVMGAFVFAAQMINFSIPGTGASGHLCGSMLLGAVLGPCAGFLTMTGILLIQCLLFADGGILALGANIWNMAFWGCFLGAGILWKAILRKGFTKKKIMAASVIGCVFSLQLGAFGVVLQTTVSGITKLPFLTFVSVMQPIHLAIGLVEGLITGAILGFVYEARPSLLWGYTETPGEIRQGKKVSAGTMLVVFAVAAMLTAGVLSLFASENPDGLEWSVERVAGEEQPEAAQQTDTSGKVHFWSQRIQDRTALLPDYKIPVSEEGEEKAASGAFSGMAGGIVVAGLCGAVGLLVQGSRKRRAKRNVK